MLAGLYGVLCVRAGITLTLEDDTRRALIVTPLWFYRVPDYWAG